MEILDWDRPWTLSEMMEIFISALSSVIVTSRVWVAIVYFNVADVTEKLNFLFYLVLNLFKFKFK